MNSVRVSREHNLVRVHGKQRTETGSSCWKLFVLKMVDRGCSQLVRIHPGHERAVGSLFRRVFTRTTTLFTRNNALGGCELKPVRVAATPIMRRGSLRPRPAPPRLNPILRPNSLAPPPNSSHLHTHTHTFLSLDGKSQPPLLGVTRQVTCPLDKTHSSPILPVDALLFFFPSPSSSSPRLTSHPSLGLAASHPFASRHINRLFISLFLVSSQNQHSPRLKHLTVPQARLLLSM